MPDPIDTSLAIFGAINIKKDRLKAVRAILSYPLINWVSQYFSRTRDADGELMFVSFCNEVLNAEKGKLMNREWEQCDRALIHYELSAYDRLNEFDKYIELFNACRRDKPYTITYSKNRNDEIINKYVLYEDQVYKYVHFLYGVDFRYQIILRKYEKQRKGKLPDTMLRRQMEDLTPEEYDLRIEQLQKLLDYIISRYQSGGGRG